ncbi:hypothetical protein TCAL_04021 [Tigriopus californicus]|uniref:PHD-type domain-containing protein n=1 Tax=Tigriopus californicus TaxID=6832 RepID=A0A553NAQ6_TIGCA|nr:hypothetical protein TCAL_04021 [Tigriopus californicus]|eukprot:TCALIF_04021-PA protein Name:"Similar to PHF12 PHD finger protein 12 (Homo sapiens)" AED:0.11 eAED:0.11 QI:0/0.83/0.71/0.85/0.83/0.71/7/0/684
MIISFHTLPLNQRKGHNHDSCDACGEGGDLICCDSCPASFHFSCHAPPLEESDIPLGDWVCLRCHVRETERFEAIKAHGKSTNPGAPALLASDAHEEAGPSVSPAPAAAPASSGMAGKLRGRSSRGNKKQVEAVLKAEKEKAVKIYRQKYDKYLIAKPATNSIFDKLIAAAQVVNAEQFKLPDALDPKEKLPFSWKWSEERQDDYDTYPKNCTQCAKTSRHVPSVGCDFCSNVYHLDCLDPPLCEIPNERWMCPMHVEHILDSKLVSSTSLTERMNLWNKYARKPVDTDTVRLNFFRKVRSGKLYQKCRVKVPSDFRVKVPAFIKHQYKNPSPGHALGSIETPIARKKSLANKELDSEQTDFLTNLISLQSGLLELQGEELRQEILGPQKTKKKSKKKIEKKLQPREDEGHLTQHANPMEIDKSTEMYSLPNGLEKGASTADEEDNESDETASNCSIPLDREDQGLSSDLHEQLNAYMARQKSQGLENLSPVVRDFLALQRLKEILPTKVSNPEHEIQIRAALVPIHHSRTPAYIRYRNFRIGFGSHNDLDLSSYGHCNYISDQHATIYFDQFTQIYEMINYSAHGLIADNSIYALDLGACGGGSMKAKSAGQNENEFVMSAKNVEDPGCFCDTSIASMMSDQGGNENSAILHHGSYLRFGCLEFVFSVMNQPEIKSEQNETRD